MPNQKSSQKPKKVEKPKYKVMITILGHNYTGEGETFESACQKLGLHWKDVRGKGLITVWKGGKKVEKLWDRSKIVRFISHPAAQHTQARYFELFLK